MSRTPAALLAAALALSLPLAIPTHAEAAFTQYPVSIPASQPDDNGNPVTIDGGIDVPTTGCPCPVVIINHGFLGQWTDSQDVASALADHGYIVLRYSSRGFGKTPGQVDLIGPKEQQDFLDAVHWVNNEGQFKDATGKVTYSDPVMHPILAGKVIFNDVGQYGGSYGGGHAWFAAESGDPAIRTAIPTATWTDFYQALMPNDVLLAAYVNGFYATGYDPTASTINNASNGNPAPPDLTQNYSTELHRWIAEANSGVNVADMKAGLNSRSVIFNIRGDANKVNIPVFIVQGSNDGLFTENQALEAYQALKAQDPRFPVRLYIGGIGHPPSDGSTGSLEARHIGDEMLAWFDHYLKGVNNGIDRMPPIEFSTTTYFHNKQPCTQDATGQVSCVTRSSYSFPAGSSTDYYLCATGPGGGTLSTAPCPSATPLVATNLPGAGGGVDQEPVTHSAATQVTGPIEAGIAQLTCAATTQSPPCQAHPDLSSYPAILTFDSAPMAAATQWFGPPNLDLQVGSTDVLPAGEPGSAAAFQLDPKFYDVAPDGTATLITRGAYARPLNGSEAGPTTLPAHSVRYDAFGLSYLIPQGHVLRMTLSTSDVPYLRPTVNPFAIALFPGSTLAMPTADDSFPTPAIGHPRPAHPRDASGPSPLPD